MKRLFIITVLFIGFCQCSFSQYIYTIAGNGYQSFGGGIGGYSGDGGPATAAELNQPSYITTDVSGNIYVADQNNNRIRKISTIGIITTVAGNGNANYRGDGGLATAAELDQPNSVNFDASGNMDIADMINNVIRQVNTSGIISTVAGNGVQGYSGDGGPSTAAELSRPQQIIADASGNLYIADAANTVVRKVNTAGVISTIAGNFSYGGGYSGDGGPATAAELSDPVALAFDASGNLYISDQIANCVIRMVNTSGIISTYAGNGVQGYSGDGGPATAAEFWNPGQLAFDNLGNLYIGDASNRVVREINTSGIITTIAGNGIEGYTGDGGLATAAEFGVTYGVTLDASGTIYIVDTYNNVVRKLSDSAGNGAYGPITGYVYTDNNNDCIYDAGDSPLCFVTMKLMHNGSFFANAITDNTGKYTFNNLPPADTFNIEIDSAPFPLFNSVCPLSGFITDTTNSVNNNFALLCNGGFDLGGTLGACIFNSVSSTDVNIVACLYNYGCQPVNSSLKIVLDTAIHVIAAFSDSLPIISGDTLSWKFDSLSSNSFLNTCIQIAATIDSLPPNDSIPVSFIAYPIAGDSVPGNNTIVLWLKPAFTYCTGYPYDPNGKTVSPVGDISSSQILTYQVHFQNTGISTATNVVVTDTLSPYLDITTLHIVSSSSPMTTQILNGSVLKFIFTNINLVDTAVSRLNSIGNLTYTIKPLPDVASGTVINNDARIYFDNNPAILTNTTQNTINTSIITTVQPLTSFTEHILCFPNPFHNSATVLLSSDGNHYLEVDDITGRKLKEIEFNGKQYELSAQGLSGGFYFIRAFDGENNLIGVSKIVIEK